MSNRDDITHMLNEGPLASERLFPLLYDELRALAAARLRRLPPGATLQPTALVHEAYVKLVRDDGVTWQGRAHFFGAAANAMRDILVDRARRRSARKHGGGRDRLPLDSRVLGIEARPGSSDEDLLALDDALTRLSALDERQGRVVTLMYYAGLTQEQIAEMLEVSVRTIERDWRFARAWLTKEMRRDGENA
jgi:RNA polymerase sigma factor (TIGR02999 family)